MLRETVDRCHILPGRHQPPHRDHLTVIHRTLDAIDGPLVIGLVVPAPGPIPAFGDAAPCPITDALRLEAAAHHAPERNPYPYLLRRAMLWAALEETVPAAQLTRITICPLPPPESAWSWIEAMLPAHRTWVVPDCGEGLDDVKARFFRARGDAVMRVPFAPTCNGGTVRRLLAERDARVATMVPPAVARMLLDPDVPRAMPTPSTQGARHDLAHSLH